MQAKKPIPVPFLINQENDCGPTALRMVLEYFGDKSTLADIRSLAHAEPSGVVFTAGLVKAAVELGFPVTYWTSSLSNTHEDLKFYRTHYINPQDNAKRVAHLIAIAQAAGAIVEEHHAELDEILTKVTKDCIPIVLIDWNIIVGKGAFHGHFVPVVGYDKYDVIVHQPGPKNPTPEFRIPRLLFDRARAAKGTDEDVVFISRKR